MLTAFEHHWKTGFHKMTNILLVILGVFFIVAGTYSFANHGYGWLVAIFYIIGIYFTIGRGATRRAMVRIRTRRSPAYGKTIHMTFSHDGIQTRIPEAYNSTVKWDYYFRALAISDGIMLYQNPSAFLWLPKASFETDRDFLNMLDLLQKHVMEFKEADY